MFFDEPMFLPEVSMGSILPVMSAQADPQAWYTGSAVDQSIHEDGVVFSRVRNRALSGDHDRLAYFEWSLDHETPDEVDAAVMADAEAAVATNPAYGRRIQADYVEAERRELDSRTLAVERYGVGDWPPVDGSGSHVIPVEVWDRLADDPAAEGARMLDPVLLAFAVRPDRSASAIVAAGRRGDGLAQLEVVEHGLGTSWVPSRLADLQKRHDVNGVRCVDTGPAGALVHLCKAAGVSVEPVSSSDYAKACGSFFDTVDQARLRHLGGADLRNAIKGATKRSLSEAWVWDMKNATVDLTPLVAGTLSLWGLDTQSGGGIAY